MAATAAGGAVSIRTHGQSTEKSSPEAILHNDGVLVLSSLKAAASIKKTARKTKKQAIKPARISLSVAKMYEHY